jgi:hypothetical protein
MEMVLVSDRTTIAERLHAMVASDLRPVRRRWSPAHRLVLLAPLAVVGARLAERAYGRSDLAMLGVVNAWGLSAIQWVLGLIVLGVALRLAVPGHTVSRRTVLVTLASAVVAISAITAITYLLHPTVPRPGRYWHVWYYCVTGSLQLSLPLLILSTILVARSFPTNPAGIGALCGLGAGVVTDAGWRLTCWVSAPAHVLGAHFVAVALAGLSGAVLSSVLDRWRWRSR